MTPRYHYTDARGEHAHWLDDKPLIGTSRVVSVLAKPLTWWASGLAVQVFGCPDPKVLTKIKNGKATVQEKYDHQHAMDKALEMIQHMNVLQFSKLVDQAYRAHATTLKEKAATGTDLHAELERFVKDHIAQTVGGTAYLSQITPFMEWTEQNVKRFLWSEGHCYSEKWWLGGISDVGYESKDGNFGIIDFKSAKEAYMSHFWQIAGYAIQIEENGLFDADGNQLQTPMLTHGFTFDEACVFTFGAEKPKPQFNFDMAGSKEAFLACLTIYRKLPQD